MVSKNKFDLPERISLIGFMGSGKSTVGKMLAQRLNYRFVDIDELIIGREGESISKIFLRKGETYFRELESVILNDITRLNKVVISCGGGIVLCKKNRDILKRETYLVWLRCDLKTALQRCGNSDRPLLQVNNSFVQIKDLFVQRELFYQVLSDNGFYTDHKTITEITDEIITTFSNTIKNENTNY